MRFGSRITRSFWVVEAANYGFELLPHHPPYSPNFTSSDFFLFPEVKYHLRNHNFGKNSEIICVVEEVLCCILTSDRLVSKDCYIGYSNCVKKRTAEAAHGGWNPEEQPEGMRRCYEYIYIYIYTGTHW